VSVATVSRVLNSPALVSPDTTRRVRRAIDELAYQPNLFAKGLMTRRSNVLAIALPDLYGEFYSELLRGADSEAHTLGYQLLVSSEARLRNGHATNHLAFGLVDGIALMVTEPNEALIEEAERRGRPLVALDVDLRSRGIDSVVIDNSTGARDAMRHLLATTVPDRCYFVGGPRDNYDTVERLAAFRAALAEAGHKARADQATCGEYEMEYGERWWRERPDHEVFRGSAILAGNDEIAYGILTAAQEDGMRVPDELRIIGFDNSRLSLLARPRLTSVRIPAAEAGAAAIRALVNRVNHPETPASLTLLPTKLVVRESTG
jgi:DNA-binding LacI/PurR family transcriptional regulator